MGSAAVAGIHELSGLGVCPSHAILLPPTICRHLCRSRLETVQAASPSRRRAQTWCDLFVTPCALNYSLGRSGFDALGVGGRNSYASDSFEPAASHLPASPFPRTKDDSDRLLRRRPAYLAKHTLSRLGPIADTIRDADSTIGRSRQIQTTVRLQLALNLI